MLLNIGIKGIFILRHFLLGGVGEIKIADGGIVTVEKTLEIFMIMVTDVFADVTWVITR